MQKLARGNLINAYAPDFKPPRAIRYWRPTEDIYQIGLLALTLLSGEIITNDVKKPFVNKWTSKDGHLRAVIKRAISVSGRDRYTDAADMLKDL